MYSTGISETKRDMKEVKLEKVAQLRVLLNSMKQFVSLFQSFMGKTEVSEIVFIFSLFYL